MATVYFDWTLGDDTRTYAQAQNPATPWKNLSKANTSATTGDTLVLADGTYTMETITFSSKQFTITAANLPSLFSPYCKVIMDGGSVGTNKKWNFTAAGNSSITGIKFQNYLSQGGLAKSGGGATGTLTLSQCDFYNIRTVMGYDLGGLLELGYSNGSMVINNCRIYKVYRINPNTDPIGGMLLGGAGTSTLTINGLKIYLDGTGSDQFASSYGIGVRWNSGTCIYDATNIGIWNAGDTLAATSFGTSGTLTYSKWYGITTMTGSSGTGNGVLTENPFVDPSSNSPNVGGDYRLKAGSQLSKVGKPR